MRTSLVLVAVVLMTVMISACSEEAQLYDAPPAVKLYGVEKANITYTYGGTASGSKTHMIANYGMFQKLEDNMSFSFNGQPRNVRQLDITTDTIQYSVDLSTMKGTKRSFDTTRLNALIKDFTEEERNDFQAAYILHGGGELIGEETILDRTCSVYKLGFSNIQVALWKGLTMKMEVAMGEDMLTMVATELDVAFSPTHEMFTPPADVTWEEPAVIGRMPQGHPPVEPGDTPPEPDMPAGHPPVN